MGPRLVSHGKVNGRILEPGDPAASMGPRLVSRGKLQVLVDMGVMIMLQWGRDLLVAES